jgi:hypothetical protein
MECGLDRVSNTYCWKRLNLNCASVTLFAQYGAPLGQGNQSLSAYAGTTVSNAAGHTDNRVVAAAGVRAATCLVACVRPSVDSWTPSLPWPPLGQPRSTAPHRGDRPTGTGPSSARQQAVAHGIKTTAGVVTSAAIVMVGVFPIFAALQAMIFK